MSVVLAGAIAAALATTSLVLAPFGAANVLALSVRHPERALLREAGWPRSLVEWECVRVAAAAVGLAIAGSLGVLPFGLVGAVIPTIVARGIAARRRDARARETVALLHMTLAGLRSGATLTEALRFATRLEIQDGLEPFSRAVRAFDLGASLDAALRDERAQARDRRVILTLDALSLCMSEQLPATRSAILIASAADRLVFEQRMLDDVRARTSGLRAQIVLLAALVPGLAFYLVVTVPGMAETFATPLGRFVLLPLATLLETAGIVASRHLVRDIT